MCKLIALPAKLSFSHVFDVCSNRSHSWWFCSFAAGVSSFPLVSALCSWSYLRAASGYIIYLNGHGWKQSYSPYSALYIIFGREFGRWWPFLSKLFPWRKPVAETCSSFLLQGFLWQVGRRYGNTITILEDFHYKNPTNLSDHFWFCFGERGRSTYRR